jgi:S-adenosylmethionine:tRNA ribosyltransferase-isomerase
MDLRTSDFDYELPEELIAQWPLQKRDASALLVLGKEKGEIQFRNFSDLPDLLRSGDRLVLNDTKVLPARLFCRKSTGAEVELLFVTMLDSGTWRVMSNPGRRLKVGSKVSVKENEDIFFIVKEICANGDRIVSLDENCPLHTVDEVINAYGVVPLPPYISRKAIQQDRLTYQTIYAKSAGAIAAPTAGMHFTEALIASLERKGISFSYLTLHVGPGTFTPVKEESPRQHIMHEECYNLPQTTAIDIAQTRKTGGRVIAVGTTVVRVLETCAIGEKGDLNPGQGKTSLMILPPSHFKSVDGLITNFHLPCSTLLMLVCAFAGTNNTLKAYRQAVQEKLRFYSYGDAMLVI